MSASADAGDTEQPRPLPQAGGGQKILPPPAYLARLTPGAIVASYIPLGSEADPAALIDAALAHGCTLALPHVIDRANPMRFLEWHPATPLEPGIFGLRQPPATARDVAPDIVLVPLVAFDPTLHRLGQGAGYYDRALAGLPDAWRLGIAWSVQQVPQVPVDPWDVPLHGVVTERSVFLREKLE
ncbi:5-formyltetrahydrofolate cyclo-ligase [Sphingomonas sp. S1-29]|uniref:5-formyltetrahydrofolate cyclo-ligase n=1 Tax=Sphingomonas sp. S1-29 TaxID=2991074 RepID=UPI00223F7D9F|nr:5-formyltetrahydrofolate cyclo-ligase [Sphingomonas sp. S1-29]UZK70982.1 5-formyltetrahydrofolate cyclo-ligase [Sphingomonas sp. S1-29]